MSLRIGITMRETHAQNYFEPRDSLARDWPNFLNLVFPNEKWMFIPNIGEKALELFEKWDLNVLILSGGDNIGVSLERDETEELLLKHAVSNEIPVIGICRGLQLIHRYFGGSLISGNEIFTNDHRATEHSIIIGKKKKIVNSYHNNLLDKESISSQFEVLAICEKDKTIECLRANNILAMMWHPEREKTVSDWNKDLIINFLYKK